MDEVGGWIDEVGGWIDGYVGEYVDQLIYLSHPSIHHSFTYLYIYTSIYLYIHRSEVSYKAKKVSSVTFQAFHCLTLNVQSTGKRSSEIYNIGVIKQRIHF